MKKIIMHFCFEVFLVNLFSSLSRSFEEKAENKNAEHNLLAQKPLKNSSVEKAHVRLKNVKLPYRALKT